MKHNCITHIFKWHVSSLTLPVAKWPCGQRRGSWWLATGSRGSSSTTRYRCLISGPPAEVAQCVMDWATTCSMSFMTEQLLNNPSRKSERDRVCEGGERVRRKASPHPTAALTALRIVRTKRSQVRFTFVTGQRAHPSQSRWSRIFLSRNLFRYRRFSFSF